jgi:hypothetical protein
MKLYQITVTPEWTGTLKQNASLLKKERKHPLFCHPFHALISILYIGPFTKHLQKISESEEDYTTLEDLTDYIYGSTSPEGSTLLIHSNTSGNLVFFCPAESPKEIQETLEKDIEDANHSGWDTDIILETPKESLDPKDLVIYTQEYLEKCAA